MTVTIATANGTGREIMTVTVIAIATVNGTKNVTATATARRREPVAPGTTGMTMMHDGHRVTTVNEIWRVTLQRTVVTETEIDMLHEDQVRERTTGNGV